MATLTLTKTPATLYAPDPATVTRTGFYYTRDGRTALTATYRPDAAPRHDSNYSNPNYTGELTITARNLPGFRSYGYPTTQELRRIADDMLAPLNLKRSGQVHPTYGWNVAYDVERA